MKKRLIIILSVLVIIALGLFQFRMINYKNDQYRFSFKYSAIYEKENNGKMLIYVRNKINNIEISAVAMEVSQKYDKPLQELGERYTNNLTLFHEDEEVETLQNETISISNGMVEAQKVVHKVIYENAVGKEIAILIPLDDREITFLIRGTEKAIDKNQRSIENIINSIKIY